MLEEGNRTIIGGVPGLEVAGSMLRAVRAADEEDVDIEDSVWVLSPFVLLLLRREGAGSVAIECREEIEPLRDGKRSPLTVDVSDGDW